MVKPLDPHTTDFSFNQFKDFVKPPTALSKAFGAFGFGANLSDEKLRVEFDKIDIDRGGTLSHNEIRMALQHGMKKSDEEINRLMTFVKVNRCCQSIK